MAKKRSEVSPIDLSQSKHTVRTNLRLPTPERIFLASAAYQNTESETAVEQQGIVLLRNLGMLGVGTRFMVQPPGSNALYQVKLYIDPSLAVFSAEEFATKYPEAVQRPDTTDD